MKIVISIALTFLLLSSCSDVKLEEPGGDSSNIVVINAEPPAVTPGNEVNISAIIDNGKGTMKDVQFQIGNNVFTDNNSASVTIPDDISKLFGDETAKAFRDNNYVDVPVKIISGTNTATKYFRIAGANYSASLYDENPTINTLSYIASPTGKVEIDPEEGIMFDPDSVPEKISFSVDEIMINDSIKDHFVYSWEVFGTGSEMPQIVESDEFDGSVTFSLRDSGGAPLIGTYRFYLVVKPEKTYPLTYEARYCNGFTTFTVNTTGDTDTEEVSDTVETDDTESEVSDA